ncbi:sodium-dependent bicarbonate transport family permease [Pseudoalteromonas luteoviolacea]|uniref:Permease n=1 Tax=Pseudoalteromonas luteoviolacea S4054 TaxID=1129367 RepID=A0A0F6A9A8_9GAMM|nr:sodium-dependent bicarbonate transport family permease [Pseudoalteromonas luteoviolacea]AOT06888.1 sodium-dependent bicarbonate transport family permease [Pseudoalteromonas luteoviolacea]AOT11806.1 sodium-dependent bicarbonate transport family permease [Pseudoalteromonas luteoviolacea]AOT16718.1 sodium-dependent bicarbonate transport family permease [Pseudoalteromonas luteoviolacea]KKE82787.1 permease [Pseudoalteromonas luteoviolacea S4054]KZN72998.1 permease [Pseudoalteromonas luteoviolace
MIDAVVAFFLLGIAAQLLGAKIPFPDGLYKTLSLFLMVAIGLKGGIALQQHVDPALLTMSLAVVAFGLLLPLVAYPILRYFGQLDKINAGAIAAHYGSVSVATYAVAVALLEAGNIAYEAYFPLFVVLLEMPAILVGLVLAKGNLKVINRAFIKKELVANQSILLMVGSLAIGFAGGESVQKLTPFFVELFSGVLALFLLKMGLVAGEQLGALKKNSLFLISFAVLMPMLGGLAGTGLGMLLNLSAGGIALMAVLGASASYIAVPAAMKESLPEANAGMSITASLGITFPFNVLLGVPFFIALGQYLAA